MGIATIIITVILAILWTAGAWVVGVYCGVAIAAGAISQMAAHSVGTIDDQA